MPDTPRQLETRLRRIAAAHSPDGRTMWVGDDEKPPGHRCNPDCHDDRPRGGESWHDVPICKDCLRPWPCPTRQETGR